MKALTFFKAAVFSVLVFSAVPVFSMDESQLNGVYLMIWIHLNTLPAAEKMQAFNWETDGKDWLEKLGAYWTTIYDKYNIKVTAQSKPDGPEVKHFQNFITTNPKLWAELTANAPKIEDYPPYKKLHDEFQASLTPPPLAKIVKQINLKRDYNILVQRDPDFPKKFVTVLARMTGKGWAFCPGQEYRADFTLADIEQQWIPDVNKTAKINEELCAYLKKHGDIDLDPNYWVELDSALRKEYAIEMHVFEQATNGEFEFTAITAQSRAEAKKRWEPEWTEARNRVQTIWARMVKENPVLKDPLFSGSITEKPTPPARFSELTGEYMRTVIKNLSYLDGSSAAGDK